MKYLFLTILTLLSLSHPVYAEESPKRLIIGMSQYPSTLHPGIDSMMAKTYTLGFTRRPLTVYDQKWEKICMLCTEIPTYDNGRITEIQHKTGQKGLAVKFTLHPDARWGDGTEITTKDVLFTWNIGKDSDVGISNFELYNEDIVDVIIHDDKNFTFHMDKVTCDASTMTDFNILPAHIEDKPYQKGGAEYRNNTSYDTDTANAGLYNGPYIITDKKPGISITLARNPHWWGAQKPYYDEIILKTIENTNSLSAQLLTGQINMIAGELGLPMDSARSLEKRLKKKGDQRFQFIYKPGLIYEHIDLNHDNPHFSDVRVRKALLHAINREAISQQLFDGKQPVAHHNVHPLDKIYFNDTPRYPYDPQRASALLKEAGWQKSENGTLKNKKGETLRFLFQTTSGNKSRELVQQAIKADFTKIGVDAVIKNETPRVLFGETLQKRKFEGAVMYAWLSAPENIPKTTLHSDMIPSAENSYAGQNYLGYKNTEMDLITEDLETVCEEPARSALWEAQQTLYAEDLPALPLYFRADSYILPQNFNGLTPTGHQFPSSLWVENWQEN